MALGALQGYWSTELLGWYIYSQDTQSCFRQSLDHCKWFVGEDERTGGAGPPYSIFEN